MKNNRGIMMIALVTALAGTVFATTTVHTFFHAPEREIAVPAAEERAPSRSLAPVRYPSRLIVPSLGIDAAVQHVGINRKGNMATPSNFTDVGWYTYGPPPGQMGSAVIAGHVDNGLGMAGVFKRLGELRPGDDIYVETKDGQRLHFTVTELQAYPLNDVPTKFIFNRTDKARLNLITCVGVWIPSKKTYDQRLVVFAQMD